MTEEQQRIVEENLPLVRFIVGSRYRNARELGEFEDVVQIGNVGLCRAAESYKPETGIKFSTYAARCVHNEIKQALRERKAATRVPDGCRVSLDDREDDAAALLELIQDPLSDVGRAFDARETYRHLAEAFSDDPILLEVATGQMSQQEAADLLGLSQPTVHRRIKMILKKYREMENSDGKNQHGCGSQLS